MQKVAKASRSEHKLAADRRVRRPQYAGIVAVISTEDPAFLRETLANLWRSCERQMAEREARQTAHDALKRAIEAARTQTYPASFARYDAAAETLLELVGESGESMSIDRMFVRTASQYATHEQIAAAMNTTVDSVRTKLKEVRRAARECVSESDVSALTQLPST